MLNNRYRIDYENDLNPSQYEAVTFTDGPLLVIAGAGSGKTRTLTYRVARLVEEGVYPASILLLTFTRKSAQEMLKRATTLLDERCEQVSGGTFHSFANSTLRKHGHLLGIGSGFTIMDRADTENLFAMLIKDHGISKEYDSFPKKGTVANVLGKAVNKSKTIEDIIYDDYPHLSNVAQGLVRLSELYKQAKADQSFLDYDDLLVFLKKLLTDFPDTAKKLANQFDYVMVDEYQDTNLIQAEITRLICGESPNIMVVGDDSQSIYSFRGANFQNIMDFPGTFENTKIIRLEENYRSRQPILNLTNRLIEGAREKYTKKLFTNLEGGTKPTLISAGSENRQSNFIVETMEQIASQGVPLSEIAVLFRAGFHSFDLEIELTRAGIPFVKYGGFKFMESAHIKDVLAHMRVISSPSDRLSWSRILLLIDKIGPKAASNIYNEIKTKKSGYAGLFTIRPKPAYKPGFERLQELYAEIDAKSFSVAELGEIVLKYYAPYMEDKFDDFPKRAKDLEHLLAIMHRYSDITEFMTDMALEPPSALSGGVLSEAAFDDDKLVLSTIHSAKGLEWHTVFVINVLDGRFPSVHSINKNEDLEEELRLMYVAATRARENLFFVYPGQAYDRASGVFMNSPSRFLDDIPDEFLEMQYWD